MYKSLLSVSCMMALSPLLVAAENNDNSIIITATRTAQTADETIAPVIVIDRAEIERNPGAAVSDLLRLHAGIDIGRNGGPSQQTSIFIRGAESNHTLVMIDGVKINPGTIGTAAVQNIQIDMIERIEIVKGPRSTLYGSDAIGGVINIITRRGEEEGSSYQVRLTGGSFGTQGAGFNAHNKTSLRELGISVNAMQSDGYAIRSTSPVERGYDNLNLHMYGKQRFATTDVELAYWNSTGTTEYLDFFLAPVDQDFANSSLSLSFNSNFTASWLSKLKLSTIKDQIDQNQSADFAHTQRNVLDWQNDLQLSEQQLLSAGIYVSDEHTEASVFGTGFDQNTSVNAVFIQDDIQLGNHHVIAGARYTDHEVYGDHTTTSLDYSLALSDNVKVNAGIATGFRSPDSTDLFGGFSANPDLLPEESENTEIGLEYKVGNQHKLRINYFDNEITNLIDFDALFQLQNIATAQITGTELEYQMTTDHLLVKASAIFQDPENRADGSQLSRRSKESYTLAIDYISDRYQLGVDVLHNGERDNSAFDTLLLDAYTLVNLKANYRVSDSLSLNARIENVTDKEYELAAGYNTPERSTYFEARYQF